MNSIKVLFVVLMAIISLPSSMGFYIKNSEEKSVKGSSQIAAKNRADDWRLFQNTLGLSKQKVKLLKSQKDQEGTKELLSRFIKENPKYLVPVTEAPKNQKQSAEFTRLYQLLVNRLKASKGLLKTSLNFELADRPRKTHKRPRRKIAVKMVSDLSSQHVDDLLEMFYQKHNINPNNYDDTSDGYGDNDGDFGNENYSDLLLEPPMHSIRHGHGDVDGDGDNDDDDEILYDDEGDVNLLAKSRQNSEFGSFQDLIMKAQRNQWERENEETKLHNPVSDQFV